MFVFGEVPGRLFQKSREWSHAIAQLSVSNLQDHETRGAATSAHLDVAHWHDRRIAGLDWHVLLNWQPHPLQFGKAFLGLLRANENLGLSCHQQGHAELHISSVKTADLESSAGCSDSSAAHQILSKSSGTPHRSTADRLEIRGGHRFEVRQRARVAGRL